MDLGERLERFLFLLGLEAVGGEEGEEGEKRIQVSDI